MKSYAISYKNVGSRGYKPLLQENVESRGYKPLLQENVESRGYKPLLQVLARVLCYEERMFMYFYNLLYTTLKFFNKS